MDLWVAVPKIPFDLYDRKCPKLVFLGRGTEFARSVPQKTGSTTSALGQHTTSTSIVIWGKQRTQEKIRKKRRKIERI